MKRRCRRVLLFLFRRDADTWLSLFRIGVALHLVLYCIVLRRDWLVLFASTGSGVMSRQFSEALMAMQSPFIPVFGWFIHLFEGIGMSERSVLSGAWFLLLTAGCLLALGLFSRAAAVAAWFLHLCAAKSGTAVTYGVDNFMTMALFYLMLSPLPDRRALDWRFRPRVRLPRARLLGFFRRVLQLHLCVIYFFGGLTKALGSGWWNGENIWRALTRPPYDVIPAEFLLHLVPVLPLLGLSVWMIELGYPVMIWLKPTRQLWLVLICVLHAGIAVAMGLHLFGLIMIILNVAAFGPGAARRRFPLDARRSAWP